MMAQHCMLTFFWGIQTSIAKKPYIFVIFQGGGGGGGGGQDPCPPSESAHAKIWLSMYDLQLSRTSIKLCY